jgi:UDP-glucuronate 4-epimerase
VIIHVLKWYIPTVGVSLVTGCAGFIGSHLTEALLAAGEHVIGVDCFLSESYDPEIKKSNLENFSRHQNFTFLELDLRKDSLRLSEAIRNVSRVFHLAAMPGLPLSWENTNLYIDCNVSATSNLISALNEAVLEHFIFISTSSVYGAEAVGNEMSARLPVSPYGATKLSAEELLFAHVRARNFPLTVLRFFSVYGPRQRPDMAYSKFITNMMAGKEVQMFGNGEQTRSNTYVLDAVQATIDLGKSEPHGEIFNVGGREKIMLIEAVTLISEILEKPLKIERCPARLGDQLHTFADTQKLLSLISDPFRTTFIDGIRNQIEWAKSH